MLTRVLASRYKVHEEITPISGTLHLTDNMAALHLHVTNSRIDLVLGTLSFLVLGTHIALLVDRVTNKFSYFQAGLRQYPTSLSLSFWQDVVYFIADVLQLYWTDIRSAPRNLSTIMLAHRSHGPSQDFPFKIVVVIRELKHGLTSKVVPVFYSNSSSYLYLQLAAIKVCIRVQVTAAPFS